MRKDKLIAPKNVVNLYDITGITPLAGIQDYTEGIYNGDPSMDYGQAQKNQHNYLLDEIGAEEGFRLLDVGCGLGTLLETAEERGVIGTGITISEDQAERCRAKGLDVHLLNYRHIPDEWTGRFDGIIANGSIEHFCQPEDALEGVQNDIYIEMFEIFHKLLDPKSVSQRVASTVAHFGERTVDPKKILRHPFLQVFDPEGFYSSILHRGYGGYYPKKGQLRECAKGHFKLIREVEGTEDYHLTSEHWADKYKQALFSDKEFQKQLLRHLFNRPMHTIWTASSFVGLQAWPWQFRGNNPPARLYRHTW